MIHALKLLNASILLFVLNSTLCLAGDPSHGALIAEQWCSSCHIVSASQQRGSGVAPSFSSIARRLKINADQLAQSLLVPHPQMQDRDLSYKEAEDIAAYIRSLDN